MISIHAYFNDEQIIKQSQIFQAHILVTLQLMLKSDISQQSFKTFIEVIKKGSFVDLLQLHAFYEEIILPILNSKPSLIPLYKDQLERLVKAVNNKMGILPLKEKQILPGISNIITQISLVIGLLRKPKQKIEPNLIDKYFLNFLRDQEVRLVNHDNSSFYDLQLNDKINQKIKVRMPVLVSSKVFNKQWQIPFTALRQNFKMQKDQDLMNKKHQTYGSFKDNNFSMPMCMGCAQYYYEKVNIRYLDLQQMDVIVVPYIKELNIHKDLLKNSICGLLNSGGGIILFDCLQEYMQILPNGTFISQLEKQLYLQQISQLFKYFYPKISFGVNIELKFIPIALNPFQNIESAQKPLFIKGRYVIRLRVWNNERYRIVHYQHSTNELVVFTRRGGQTVKLCGRQLVRQIKCTFNRYYCSQRYNKQIFERPQNIFENHQCVEPKMGIQLEKKQRDQGKRLSQYDLQGTFQYISIIFLRNEDPQKFEQALKRAQANKLKIIPHNPLTGDNICLLFHDTAHREIKTAFYSVVQSIKSHYRNQNSLPFILFVQNGLELEYRLDEKLFNQLVKYIRTKNSTQTLKYFQSKMSYYLTSQFKVTLFYLLVKLRQINIHNTKLAKLDISRLENDQRFRKTEAPPIYF